MNVNTSASGSILVKAGSGDDTIDLTGTMAASITVDADGGTNTLTVPYGASAGGAWASSATASTQAAVASTCIA